MLKNLIILFGFSTFVIIVWITTTIYHNSVKTQISESDQRRIEPINSNFDLETLEQLDLRQDVSVSLSGQLSIIENAEVIDQESTPSSELTPTIEPQVQILQEEIE